MVKVRRTDTVAVKTPPDPLHPMNCAERGSRATQKPMTATGVGLAKELRSSPFTLFCGDRYSFSNCSGDKERKVFVR